MPKLAMKRACMKTSTLMTIKWEESYMFLQCPVSPKGGLHPLGIQLLLSARVQRCCFLTDIIHLGWRLAELPALNPAVLSTFLDSEYLGVGILFCCGTADNIHINGSQKLRHQSLNNSRDSSIEQKRAQANPKHEHCIWWVAYHGSSWKCAQCRISWGGFKCRM